MRETCHLTGLYPGTLRNMVRRGQIPSAFVWFLSPLEPSQFGQKSHGCTDWRFRREWAEWPTRAQELIAQCQNDTSGLLTLPLPPESPRWISLRKAAHIQGISYESARAKLRNGDYPANLVRNEPQRYMMRVELALWPNFAAALSLAASQQQEDLTPAPPALLSPLAIVETAPGTRVLPEA